MFASANTSKTFNSSTMRMASMIRTKAKATTKDICSHHATLLNLGRQNAKLTMTEIHNVNLNSIQGALGYSQTKDSHMTKHKPGRTSLKNDDFLNACFGGWWVGTHHIYRKNSYTKYLYHYIHTKRNSYSASSFFFMHGRSPVDKLCGSPCSNDREKKKRPPRRSQ